MSESSAPVVRPVTSHPLSGAMQNTSGHPSWLGGSPANLQFSALTVGVDKAMQEVAFGTGGLTTGHADTLYAKQADGVYYPYGANEPVWEGGRTVRYLPVEAVDPVASWATTNASAITIDDYVDVTFSDVSNSQFRVNDADGAGDNGDALIGSVWLKGSGNLRFSVRNAGGSEASEITIALTSTWTRYTVTHTMTSATNFMGINLYVNSGVSGATTSFQMKKPCLEDAGNREDKITPSEYVETAGNVITKVYTSTGWEYGSPHAILDNVVTENARQVTNTMRYSNDFSNGVWTKQTGVTVSDNGDGSWDLDLTSAAAGKGLYQVVTSGLSEGADVVASIEIKGTGNVKLQEPSNSKFDVTITLSGEWQRFSAAATKNPASHIGLWVAKASGGANVVQIRNSQMEDVSNRIDQSSPAEYVATTTAAASQIFTGGNPWTAASNVATAGTAPVYPIDIKDNVWLMHYPGITNTLLQSRTFDTTWNSTSGIGLAQDETGIDGTANSAWTLTDSDGASTDPVYQGIGLVADTSTHTAKIWIKKDQDETRFPAVLIGKVGTSWYRTQLNTKTGAVTTSTSAGSPTITREVVDDGDWWILYLEWVNVSATDMSIWIEAANGTVWGTETAVATGSIIVGQAELYLNKTIPHVRNLGPVFTTTAAKTVAKTNYNFDLANHNDAGQIAFVEMSTPVTGQEYTDINTSHTRVWATTLASSQMMYFGTGTGNLYNRDGFETTATTYTFGDKDVAHNLGAIWSADASLKTVGCDTDIATPEAYDGSFNLSGSLMLSSSGPCVTKWRNLRLYNITNWNDAYSFYQNLLAWGVQAAELTFNALTVDANYELQGVSTGVGSLVTTHADPVYAKQADEAYVAFDTDEPVYSGGRVVENACLHSEDFSNAVWQKFDITLTTGIDDPNGGNTAATIAATASSGRVRQDANKYLDGSVQGRVISSIWIRRRKGTGTITITGAENTNVDITAQVNGTWQRFSVAQDTNPSYNHRGYFIVILSTSGDEIDVAFGQSEYPESRIDSTTPSEYIPTTTAPVTKYMASVGWEKNSPNAVVNNVVTDNARKVENIATYSADQNTGWAITGAATPSVVSTDRPDGTIGTVGRITSGNLSTNQWQMSVSPTIPSPGRATISAWLRIGGTSVSHNVRLKLRNVSSPQLPITTQWQRFTYTESDLPAGSVFPNVQYTENATIGEYIEVYGIQVEYTENRLDPSAPSEYVETTSTAASQAFTGNNPNTVYKNIVTVGTALPYPINLNTREGIPDLIPSHSSKWVTDTGWTDNNDGSFTSAGSNQYQSININGTTSGMLTYSKKYRLQFDVDITTGSFGVYLGNSGGVPGDTIAVSGSYERIWVAGQASNGTVSLVFRSQDINSVGTISNIRLYEEFDGVWLQYLPGATNSLPYSNDFSNAAWTKSEVAVATSATELGLDGQLNVTELTENTATAQHRMYHTIVNDAGNHPIIFYAKQMSTGSARNCRVEQLGASTTVNVSVDLSNGNKLSSNGTVEVADAGNGWWKITILGNRASSSTTYPQIMLLDGVNASYTGDGASGILVAQAEQHFDKTIPEVRGLGPIFTTATAVTIDPVVYDLSAAETYFDPESTVLSCDFLPSFDKGDVLNKQIFNTNILYLHSTGGVLVSYDGANSASNPIAYAKDTPFKMAWIGNHAEGQFNIVADGVAGVDNPYNGTITAVFNNIGNAEIAWKMRDIRIYSIPNYDVGRKLAENITS